MRLPDILPLLSLVSFTSAQFSRLHKPLGSGDSLNRMPSQHTDRSCVKRVIWKETPTSLDSTIYTLVEDDLTGGYGWEEAAYEACGQNGTACAYKNAHGPAPQPMVCFPELGTAQCCAVDMDTGPSLVRPTPSLPPGATPSPYTSCGTLAPWSYDSQDDWTGLYQGCGQPNQSPIDIKTSNVAAASNSDNMTMELKGVENGFRGQLCENGNTLKLVLANKGIDYSLTRGSWGPYSLWHIEWFFKQEASSTGGSEHLLDGLRLDMEMQMVFYDKRNNDITTAIAKDKQVTVVSVLFKMDPTDNPELRDMLAALQGPVSGQGKGGSSTLNNGQEVNVGKIVDPSIFDPANATFYSYEGSMTSPPRCKNGVLWTVMAKPQPISEAQLNIFRSLSGKRGTPLGNNFRKVQTNSNPVTRVEP